MMMNADEIKQHVAQLKPTLGGKFLFYCLPFRKKIVFKNMNHVFGKILNENEIKRLALSFYSHIFTSLKENILMRFMTIEQIRKRAIVIGEENLANASGDNIRGAMVITGHVGNWEFAPIAGMLNFKNFKENFFFVRKPQAVPFLEKFLFKRYYQAGLRIIPKKNSLMQVYDVLENNQIVVFVMDQRAKHKEAIAVDFFGKKADTFRSVAMIARQTEVPVIPARSYRQPDGKHVLEFFKPLQWQTCEDASKEVYINTRIYNEALEKMILEHPEQWLWTYKRWRWD